MVLEIIISEPWDFKSSDGDNFLKVKVLERKKVLLAQKHYLIILAKKVI